MELNLMVPLLNLLILKVSLWMVCGLLISIPNMTVCVCFVGCLTTDYLMFALIIATGAAIYAKNSKVTIRNCFFFGNKALKTARGGAIFSLNSSISIEHSVFYGHRSNANGGVLYAGENSNVAIIGSVFEGNICFLLKREIILVAATFCYVALKHLFRIPLRWRRRRDIL